MLNFPITDTHVHLTASYLLPYQSLKGDYTLSMYNRDCGDIKVENIIFMECDCSLTHYREEVAFATGIAFADKRFKGIIASMPLEKGNSIEKELMQLSSNPLVKGVRRLLKFEPRDFCLNKNFIIGVRLLGKFNLSFDICTNIEQNENAARLVELCPDVNFMIDHIGTPDIRGRRFKMWSQDLKRLSEFPNVWCKLSSLATEAVPKRWSIEDIKPYTEHLKEHFGVNRLVFGSDWPVSLVSAKLRKSIVTLDKLLSGYTDSDKEKIFRLNALHFYKIDK